MINETEKFLEKYKIKNKTVILGFSAGPDSCALALILDKLKIKYNLKIVLCYFNHNWRKEALEEETFTKEFVKEHKLKFYTEKAPSNLPKTEECARNARYEFFEKCARKYKTDVVFLAHNKNDNVETLVYRIIKGTSINGLTAIPQKREIFYRPLLKIGKKEILNFLDKNNQIYKTDSSNTDTKYKRNLIRKEILPLFEKINPKYLNSIENLIQNSINAKKIIDDKIKEVEHELIKNKTFSKTQYQALGKEIRLEIINNFIGEFLKYRNTQNLEKFDNFILNNENSKISINSDLFLKIKNDNVYIEKIIKKSNCEVLIDKEGQYVFEDIILKIEKENKKIKTFPKENENFCFLNFTFPLTIRHRKQGDIFSPCGLKGKMKLKDYLINQKIEQSKKDSIVLLCKGKEIVWILSEKISENYKVTKQPFYKVSWSKNE